MRLIGKMWKTLSSKNTERIRGAGLEVYMSLGSNIGDRENNLRKAVKMIGSRKDIDVLKVSSIYETEPMYFKDQDYFYNIVLKARVDKKISPFELLEFLKRIESDFGRKKDRKNGPRIIDIDLLYYGNASLNSDFMTIPHPGIKERKFVLIPLNEISPGFKINGSSIKNFIEKVNLRGSVSLVRKW